MFKKMLSYGVLAGLLVGVPLSVITISMSGQAMMRYGMVIGYLIMLVALSAVFVAIKRHRDADLGGVIKFWPAFGLGLGISFIAGVLYVSSWESACAIAHLDFAGSYAKAMIAQQQAKGVSAEAAAQCAYCGKGAWVKSNRRAMTKAYPPSWFARQMASLKVLWRDLNRPKASAQLELAL